MADRRIGRFFTIYMNTFENLGDQIKDLDVPQRVKVQNGRVGIVDRHILDHLHKHLKHVGVKALEYLVREKVRELDGVVLSGHKEILPLLKEELPVKLKNKVKAKIITSSTIPIADLTQKAVQALENI